MVTLRCPHLSGYDTQMCRALEIAAAAGHLDCIVWIVEARCTKGVNLEWRMDSHHLSW